MSDVYVSIDLSLRSTAIVILDKEYNLINQKIVSSTTSEYNDEKLLLYNSTQISNFINGNAWKENISGSDKFLLKGIALERLSYNSPSSMADLISANSWILRVKLLDLFPTVKVDIVSVKEWRADVITAVEQRLINDAYPIIRAKRGQKLTKEEQKANNKNKQEIKEKTKELTISKLPDNIKKSFTDYLSSAKIKSTALCDLADAYFLARHLINKLANNNA